MHSLQCMTDMEVCSPRPPCPLWFPVLHATGWRTAEHASKSVYKRLVQEEAYAQGDFGNAFKKAFIDTDAEMRDGMSECSSSARL